jgi:DNA mismatch repair ATPase MutL
MDSNIKPDKTMMQLKRTLSVFKSICKSIEDISHRKEIKIPLHEAIEDYNLCLLACKDLKNEMNEYPEDKYKEIKNEIIQYVENIEPLVRRFESVKVFW